MNIIEQVLNKIDNDKEFINLKYLAQNFREGYVSKETLVSVFRDWIVH